MRCAILLLVGVLAVPVAAAEQPVGSAAVAGRLAALLAERQLDAFAVHDAGTADRFVAALFIPGVQLLVVAGQYPSASALHTLIAGRQYRDVYSALQQPSAQASRVFFLDLGCDGLHAQQRETVDVLYEKGTSQTVFDGNWKKQGLSEAAYRTKFQEADAEYTRLLRLLLASLEAPAAGVPAVQ